jgi:hypothetical protein
MIDYLLCYKEAFILGMGVGIGISTLVARYKLWQ